MITDGAKGYFNIVQYLDVIEYCSKYSKLETKVEKKLLNPDTLICYLYLSYLQKDKTVQNKQQQQ